MWVIEIINWIKHNFWYKVLSLGLSVALWLYVVNTYNPVIALDASAVVEVRNVPEGLQQTSISPSEVEVRLQGRSRVLEPLGNGDSPVRLVADLADKLVGSHEIDLEPTGLPRGVKIIDAPVLRATVQLEKVTSEKRQVYVDIVGFPAAGYRARREAPRPEEVTIRGTSTAVESVQNVVARISVSDLTAPTDFQPTVQAENREGQRVPGVTVEPEQVDVRVIVESEPHRPLVIRPDFGDPPRGRQIDRFSVRPTTVVVSGPTELLDTLTSIPTREIDLTGVDREAELSVSLAPPAGVSIRGPATATVTVFLKTLPRPAPPPVVEPPAVPDEEPPEDPDGDEADAPAPPRGPDGD
jgi:YbbR domain-containing protein